MAERRVTGAREPQQDSVSALDQRTVEMRVRGDRWWLRQWRSMRRERFTRRAAVRSIAGDVLRGLRAKYVRRVP